MQEVLTGHRARARWPSVLGMNVIVSTQTHVVALVVLLAVMAVMSAAVLLWPKRKGWW